jgi:hypothetical protein
MSVPSTLERARQRQRSQERRLIRVVLERDEIKPGLFSQPSKVDHLIRVLVARGDEGTEGEFVSVIGHGHSSFCRCRGWVSLLERDHGLAFQCCGTVWAEHLFERDHIDRRHNDAAAGDEVGDLL